MGKRTEPTSLAEAIERLESASQSKSQDIKGQLEKEYNDMKKTLESMKPYFEKFKSTVETEVKEAKNQAEEKIRQHPWYAVGLVGLLMFVIGWLVGHRRDR